VECEAFLRFILVESKTISEDHKKIVVIPVAQENLNTYHSNIRKHSSILIQFVKDHLLES